MYIRDDKSWLQVLCSSIKFNYGWVWIQLLRLRLRFFTLFFFSPAADSFREQRLLFMWTVAGNCWLFSLFISSVGPWIVYGTHKSHFLVTFSLKLGPTILFTHLKIILLQCFQFSVFSFSKISSIQTDPILVCLIIRKNLLIKV